MTTFDENDLRAICEKYPDEFQNHNLFNIKVNDRLVPANRFNISEGWVDVTPLNDMTDDVYYDKDGKAVEMRIYGVVSFTGAQWWTDRIYEHCGITPQ